MANFYNLSKLGSAGVDIFFAISGFIMVYISRNAFGTKGAAVAFLKNRVRRVVPLYWVFTLFMIVADMMLAHMHKSGISVAAVLRSMLFIPAFNNGVLLEPLLPQGWTLFYEMLFYLIFAGWLAVGRFRTVLLYLAGSLTLIVLCAALLPTPVNLLALCGDPLNTNHAIVHSAIRDFFADTVVFEFVFGASIGWLFVRDALPGRRTGLILIVLSALMFGTTIFVPFSNALRVISWGIPSALLVLGSVSAERGRASIFESLGDWSYSIYLSHLLVFIAVAHFIRRLPLRHRIEGDCVILALFVVCVLVGRWSNLHLERPIEKFFKHSRLAPKALPAR